MPPMRTTPPAKAIKTERTHEENQERAYIAASRRSDRSLEARVESARRASEIHKRRTGRSLRVTEQDVINEEMYEEEDDDLPLQYRRLTAHLQTGSADFNRRLAAYLTNQVAMRSAMEQMTQYPYNQFPNGLYQQGANMFPSPMLPQQTMVQSPSASYRPGPYPSPHQPNFRQNHGRAYSMVQGPGAQMPSSHASGHPGGLDHRRMSTPALIESNDMSSAPTNNADGLDADHETQRHPFPQSNPQSFPPMWQNSSIFTTSLPPESQQMLANAPGFDPRDPTYAMLMQGSDQYTSSAYYPWQTMHSGMKGMAGPHHPYQGMSTTLAPAVLENNAEQTPKHASHFSSAETHSTVTSPNDPNALPSAGLDLHFSQESKGLDFGAVAGGLPSGQVTPAGEGFWDNFVMDGSWDESNAAGGSHPSSVNADTG